MVDVVCLADCDEGAFDGERTDPTKSGVDETLGTGARGFETSTTLKDPPFRSPITARRPSMSTVHPPPLLLNKGLIRGEPNGAAGLLKSTTTK